VVGQAATSKSTRSSECLSRTRSVGGLLRIIAMIDGTIIWKARESTGGLEVAAQCGSSTGGRFMRRVHRQAIVASHNNSLEPTPVTKARFVWLSSGAAQLKR
jgi:hypothetical protein